MPAVALGGNFPLSRHQAPVSSPGRGGRDMRVQPVRRQVFVIRIDKGAQVIESDPFDKFQQEFEIRLGFAGKTDDHRRSQGGLGHLLADPVQTPLQIRARVVAAHAAQDPIAGMLDGQIEVGADVLQAADGPHDALVDALRLAVE